MPPPQFLGRAWRKSFQLGINMEFRAMKHVIQVFSAGGSSGFTHTTTDFFFSFDEEETMLVQSDYPKRSSPSKNTLQGEIKRYHDSILMFLICLEEYDSGRMYGEIGSVTRVVIIKYTSFS